MAETDMQPLLDFKAEGNGLYQQGNFEDAILAYNKAVRLLPDLDDEEDSGPAPTPELCKQAAIILCNRAAAQMGAKRAVAALADAQRASDFDGKNWKAHWRTGLALMMMAPRLERSEKVPRPSPATI